MTFHSTGRATFFCSCSYEVDGSNLLLLLLLDLGTAYGTAKAGVGIASMGVMRPDLAMRNIIPVVMTGILGIYAPIVAVIIQGSIDPPNGNAPK
ncbi:hypothetical protein PF011_g23413 [Phytophthora fragariae]|uniref:V-ATPase proteolipid subunit C-like domain-containing protein n=1 Tax=Phytophthora fragariae TaxID=53985 RepID=A0A6A3I735_9STRA|nr:hypothetical protein PF011_g23413 [Phytophthora fragariae]